MIDVPDGLLYLGGRLDPETRKRDGEPVMLEADDLTTHGVIVGMTGSGKTGLGVVLVEEALLQGIPTLVLDPKGDLGNLLLTFPELRPADFAPWVEDGDPAEVARQWADGLADWGIGPERLATLRDAATYTIYTPGSTSGVPLNIVGSLDRPTEGTDPEAVDDEVEGFVSGLLNMVGIDSDPLSGKEHILLTNLIHHAWEQGRDIGLADLVGQVGNPPLDKLGIYQLEDFFPAKERTKLATTLNGLLASRAFAAWAEGPDLDVGELLQPGEGSKPGCAIVSLSHLADEERQFVVSLVLGKLITWMRRQPGTGKLRVLVYFDEVMGYVPPNGEPPTKKPILTLFKQARAFGVGLVLATQNPVDVDYKGLSNAGTWMIGRLQTEQDKARLLDGLKSLQSGSLDIKATDETISSLGKREFMLRSAADSAPGLFTSRWAMSYLRGPLTREQISTLMAGRFQPSATTPPPAEPAAVADAAAPKMAEGIPVRWLDPAARWAAQIGAAASGTRLAPALVAQASVLYDDTKSGIRQSETWCGAVFPLAASVDAGAATEIQLTDGDLADQSPAGASYAQTDAPLGRKTYFTGVEKAIVDHLYTTKTLPVLRNRKLKLMSEPGEDQAAFQARCRQAAAEAARADADELDRKYATKLSRAQDAVAKAQDRVAEAQATRDSRRATSVGRSAGALFGVLTGRRRSSGTALGQILGGNGRVEEASRRVDSAANEVQRRQDALAEIEQERAGQLAVIDAEWQARADDIDTAEIRPKKSNIRVTGLTLVWVPVA